MMGQHGAVINSLKNKSSLGIEISGAFFWEKLAFF